MVVSIAGCLLQTVEATEPPNFISAGQYLSYSTFYDSVKNTTAKSYTSVRLTVVYTDGIYTLQID